MNLKESLTVIAAHRKTDTELDTPFLLFSILSDKCKNGFKEKKEIETYWKVIQRINICYRLLHFKTTLDDEIHSLREDYHLVQDIVSELEYKVFVFDTLLAIYPGYQLKHKNQKETANPDQSKPKKPSTPRRDFLIIGDILTRYLGKKKKVYIPSNVRVIANNAFEQSKIQKVVIPSSVKIIRSQAFLQCRELKDIYIDKGVETIEDYAFYGCSNALIHCREPQKQKDWGKQFNVSGSILFFPLKQKVLYGDRF